MIDKKPCLIYAVTLYFFSLTSLSEASASPDLTPEDETAHIAKLLKPISNQEWNSIAGEKAHENYPIVNGDTLYDISQRLFGDHKYWPKIWSINNGNVTNPHLIFPGNSIAFFPGSGTELPTIQIGSNSSDSGTVKNSSKNTGGS